MLATFAATVVKAATPLPVKSVTGALTAAGVWAGVITMGLVIVLYWLKILPRLKEIQNANNAGLRQEFIDEMKELRAEVSASRSEVRSARDENESLHAEVRTLRTEVRKRDDKIDQLRDEIRELHGLLDGMRRENQAAQISGQRVIADTLRSLPQTGAKM